MQSSEIDVLNNKQSKLGNVKYVYDDMIGCLNLEKDEQIKKTLYFLWKIMKLKISS